MSNFKKSGIIILDEGLTVPAFCETEIIMKGEQIMKLSKKNLLEMISVGVVLQLITLAVVGIFSTLTVKTTLTALELNRISDNVQYAESQRDWIAPESVHEYANEVYESSLSDRQKLYNSEDGYVRWFAYTMGKTTGRRLCSLLIWAIEFALAAIGVVAFGALLMRNAHLARCYYRRCKTQRAR